MFTRNILFMEEKKRGPKLLTEKKKCIILYLLECEAKNFYPSLAEIGEEFLFTRQAANTHIKALEKRKLIKRTPKKPRSIRVISKGF